MKTVSKPTLAILLFQFAYFLPWFHASIVDLTEKEHPIWGTTAVFLTLAFAGAAFVWALKLSHNAWKEGTDWGWRRDAQIRELHQRMEDLERRDRQ